MYANAKLKCPEHGQGSWVAVVRIGEDGTVEILGYQDPDPVAGHTEMYDETCLLCGALESDWSAQDARAVRGDGAGEAAETEAEDESA